MLLENPSTSFVTYAIIFLFTVATINGVLAWFRKIHFMSWLSCIIFLGVGIYYLNLAMTTYTGLQLSKREEQPAIEANFALFRGPVIYGKDQIKTIDIKQEWTSRKHGPENWYEIVVENSKGEKLEPNWSISDKSKSEYEQLTKFVQEMQIRNLPVHFSYKDKQGKMHETQSITERPEQ